MEVGAWRLSGEMAVYESRARDGLSGLRRTECVKVSGNSGGNKKPWVRMRPRLVRNEKTVSYARAGNPPVAVARAVI
jgi:hypothetical protein